jgi:hypothetical protein
MQHIGGRDQQTHFGVDRDDDALIDLEQIVLDVKRIEA